MITALITLYNPSVENINNIYSVTKQADLVFVCDNSSVDNSKMLVDFPDTVIYLPNMKNLGLPKAFNKALKMNTFWQEDSWVIFFDQDSKIETGHIETLIKEVE